MRSTIENVITLLHAFKGKADIYELAYALNWSVSHTWNIARIACVRFPSKVALRGRTIMKLEEVMP